MVQSQTKIKKILSTLFISILVFLECVLRYVLYPVGNSKLKYISQNISALQF